MHQSTPFLSEHGRDYLTGSSFTESSWIIWCMFCFSATTGCDGKLSGSINTSYGTIGWFHVVLLYMSHGSCCPKVPETVTKIT